MTDRVVKVVWDDALSASYPAYHCPECGSRFFGGGRALHNASCPVATSGYAPCEVVVGPKCLAEAEASGVVPFSPGVTAEMCRAARDAAGAR